MADQNDRRAKGGGRRRPRDQKRPISNEPVPETDDDLTPIERPDRQAYEAELERLSTRMSALKVQHAEARARLDASQGAGAAGDTSQFGQESQKLRAISERQAAVKKERRTLFDRLDTIKSADEKARAEIRSATASTRYRNPEQVQDAIAAAEDRQMEGGMSLKEEKDLIRHISDLKAQQRLLQSLVGTRARADEQRASGREQRDELRARLTELREQQQALATEYDAQRAVLDSLDAERAATRGDKDRLFQAMRAVGDEKHQVYEQQKQLREQYDKQWTEYRAYQDELYRRRRVRDERRRQQFAATRRAREYEEEVARAEEAAAEAAAAADRQPWEEEKGLCDRIVAQLRASHPAAAEEFDAKHPDYVPPSAAAAGAGGAVVRDVPASLADIPVTTKAPAAAAATGLKLVSRKDEEDDFLSGWTNDTVSRKRKKWGKKGKRRAATRPASNLLTFDRKTLEGFATLKVEAPSTRDGVAAALEALVEKRAHFETAPQPELQARKKRAAALRAKADKLATRAKADKAKANLDIGTAVKTPFGAGELVNKRADGIFIVRMTEFGAMGFLNADSLL